MNTSPASDRMAKAREIASNPVGYMVCEGCDSILGANTIICPSCHSYRFDPEPDRVIEQALALGARAQRSVTAQDLG